MAVGSDEKNKKTTMTTTREAAMATRSAMWCHGNSSGD